MKCSICGTEIDDYGNNPYPVRTGADDRCCDKCNELYVITTRLLLLGKEGKEQATIANKLNNMTVDKLDKLFRR